MSASHEAELLMVKASRALASAEALPLLGDIEGACNRAYYAVFDAARAALVSRGARDVAAVARTHKGLIALFGQEFVKTGLISNEMGRVLKRSEEIRLIADYRLEAIDVSDAQHLMAQVHAFLQVIRSEILPPPS